MAIDHGTDIRALSELGLLLETHSGKRNLAEAIARRLMTPRGGLFYDEAYGEDVRAWLNETMTDLFLSTRAAILEAQAEQDERVISASATVRASGDGRLDIRLELDTSEGPLRLILGVSAVRVDLLKVE